jgi:hypothetical protein
MPLNEMSLRALQDLNSTLCALEEAMGVLETHGLVTLASLEPGRPMAIRLVRDMPQIGYVPDPVAMVWDRVGDAGPCPVAPDGDTDKYARAAGLVDNEGYPITAEAPPPGGNGERAGLTAPAPAVAGPGDAAVPTPAAPGPTPWPAWSEDHADQLVELVAVGMEFDGLSLRAAALRAAPGLGRPGDGTYMKARSLVERIEARRRALAARLPAAPEEIPAGPPAPAVQETAPEGAGEPAAGEGPEDAEGVYHGPDEASAAGVAGPGAPLTPFGEMVTYLDGLPRKRGWTLQRDHDVMHFADLGWKPAEIALELGIPADELKPRFAMLTRQGRYKRAEVLTALRDMLSPPADATAA